jgi:transcriptional regulator with GAF, ATPase, and Fis domain
MQTNERLACHHGAELCISDFRHKQGNFAQRCGGATSEQKRKSNSVREKPLPFQQAIDSSQLDEDSFSSSEALLPALVHVPRVAATDSTVLITGEIGTGTELVARAIHRLSYRSPQEFVRANCAAIPPERIASKLLGRQKGSRSQATQPRPGRFQLAEGGTIFLEGIGELSAESQLALLRVLQEIESEPAGGDDSIRSDVRQIAATHRDLGAATANGTFRSDLFCRLNVFPIKVPPLRERKEYIPMLAWYFLTHYAGTAGKKLPSLTGSVMDLLQSYPWPRNTRELQRVMERFVNLCEAKSFSVDAKCIPWESISARTFVRAESRELLPNEKELPEDALMEMQRNSLAGNLESPGMRNHWEYMNGEVCRRRS